MLLLGTTDEEYEGDPADVAVTEKDIAQILDEAAFSIRDQQLSRDLITYSFAGLRVLPGGPGDTVEGQARDGRHRGPRRHAVGRRRQVDDLPPHRPYGDEQAGRAARAARSADDMEPIVAAAEEGAAARCRQPERGRAPAAGRRRYAGPADGRRHGAAPRHALRLALLRHRPARQRRTRRWPSASTRTPRRSGRRSSTPATTSGPRRPTTCCAAVRR